MIKTLKKSGLAKIVRLFRSAWFILSDIVFTPFLTRPTPKLEIGKINKILIIRLDRIGDLVLSTPAIRSIRLAYPHAEIDLCIREYTRDLVTNNPNINKLLMFGKDIINNDYDLALALSPGPQANALAYKSGAKIRVGLRTWGGGYYLNKKPKNEKKVTEYHEAEEALALAKLAGGVDPDNRRPEVSVSPEGEAFAERFYKDNFLTGHKPVAVIHAGSRQEYIRWQTKGFAEVADWLMLEKEARVILIGSDAERELVKEVAAKMSQKPVMAVGLKLFELISIIKHANIFIGNSTGPMHLAAALGIKTVAIFGSRHPQDCYKKWGPYLAKSVIVTKDVGCKNCHPSECRDYKCMKEITTKDVIKSIKKLLE
ncbi:MAG: glycosyltransferase family 9 protein [bacterium]